MKRETRLFMVLMIALTMFMTVLTSCVIDKPYGYDFKMELLDAYDEYFEKTEALLDSTCAIQGPDFHDVIMETDAYYEYEVAKEKVDSLYNTQL